MTTKQKMEAITNWRISDYVTVRGTYLQALKHRAKIRAYQLFYKGVTEVYNKPVFA